MARSCTRSPHPASMTQLCARGLTTVAAGDEGAGQVAPVRAPADAPTAMPRPLGADASNWVLAPSARLRLDQAGAHVVRLGSRGGRLLKPFPPRREAVSRVGEGVEPAEGPDDGGDLG